MSNVKFMTFIWLHLKLIEWMLFTTMIGFFSNFFHFYCLPLDIDCIYPYFQLESTHKSTFCVKFWIIKNFKTFWVINSMISLE